MTIGQQIASGAISRGLNLPMCIDAAIAAEREGCAKIAEDFSFDDVLPGGGDELVSEAKNKIAATIRARSTEESKR